MCVCGDAGLLFTTTEAGLQPLLPLVPLAPSRDLEAGTFGQFSAFKYQCVAKRCLDIRELSSSDVRLRFRQNYGEKTSC